MKKLLIITLLAFISCSAKYGKMEEKKTIMDSIRKGENIQIVNQTIEEVLDFTSLIPKTLVGETSGVVNCKSSITFIGCTFKKPVLAYNQTSDKKSETSTYFMSNVSFINCLFEEEVNFKSCAVYGKADFSKSIFTKGVILEDMTFMQAANFRHLKTYGEARFQNTRFYHKTNFMDMVIKGNLSFQSAVFGDDTNFSVSEAEKYVDFSLARFGGTAHFSYIKWMDRGTFGNTVFNMGASFVESQLGDFSFKNTKADMEIKFIDKSGKVTHPLQ